MGVKFTKVTHEEAEKLGAALRDNVEKNKPLMMDALTTGWKPGADEDLSDESVIDAIRSVPCHY